MILIVIQIITKCNSSEVDLMNKAVLMLTFLKMGIEDVPPAQSSGHMPGSCVKDQDGAVC